MYPSYSPAIILAVSSVVNALRVMVLELPCWLSNNSRVDITVVSLGASKTDTSS
ncbi:MAG TPA: hypothetical protein VE244_13620 [Nitrososphaeraceae archaeon]|nr:hypothetical protein [Nitrososphaeraceae archaeon]